ncbi:winged helix-turn-helix domain-containing protein [Novosphingobium malaysiense]|uniref:winged helix-turn-helix domain-containing protein n=1 Tax=Novosphingobium malaysiense TaxID=1348853 RepID=UPI0006923EAF|nr:winged helix-turn-helix domain-containing protein [Novosphingobium malaysiense]
MKVLSSYAATERRLIVVTGVKRPHERATLIQMGFGDALPDTLSIEELDARAGRVAECLNWLPRLRRIGNLELDLLAREGYGNGKPLNLNPREFALIWRLADSPNRTVSKQALIHDVWRMGFVPETNSIAVHMSRLRRKLGFAGLVGVIETASEGGYSLRIAEEVSTRGAEREIDSLPLLPQNQASAGL